MGAAGPSSPCPIQNFMNEETRKTIESATVTFTKLGGQGVLVTGNIILTAAHCVEFVCTGAMALGEYFIEPIDTDTGQLSVGPLAVEPVRDIAAVGSLDDQVFFDEAEQFEKFCETTKPVTINRRDFEVFKEFPVFIYYRKEKRWVSAMAKQCREDAQSFSITSQTEIVGGMSGGPVVTESGELIAVVSHASEGGAKNQNHTGGGPRPHLTLPVWLAQRIESEPL